MIDIHSHVIFGASGGPSTLEGSVSMVREAERAGVRTIVATLLHPLGEEDRENGAEHYRVLLENTKDCNVEILLGWEVPMSPFISGLQDWNPWTLNRSGYLLIEFPGDSIPVYSNEAMYNLQLRNITPVIAHPERNRGFQRNFRGLLSFIERGCLIQADAGSIMGAYGIRVKHRVKRLIQMKMVHYVASDASSPLAYTKWVQGAYRRVCRWAGEEYADKLFHYNALKILNGELSHK